LRAVTLDVTGTLVVPRDLGGDYAAVLRRHGIELAPPEIERLFLQVLDEQRVIADPFRDPYTAHPNGARGYWGDVLRRLVALAGLAPPSPFAVVELWERFRHADAWRVLPGVPAALDELGRQDLRLGVVANWDERLEDVLTAVELRPHFAVVVRSSKAGWAKPHPAIFREALRGLGVVANEALHVGDDPVRDVEGARAAGMEALLVHDRTAPLAGLLELLRAAGGRGG
jgi:putative hydrolase of the HAD superfamily